MIAVDHEQAVDLTGASVNAARTTSSGRPQIVLGMELVDRLVELIAAVLLSAIVGILFINAFSRYAFDSPIGGTEEAATSLVVWLTMIGMYLSVRRRDLIRVTMVLDRFTGATRSRLIGLTYVVTALFFIYLAWVSASYVSTFGPDRTPFLNLPKGLFTSAIPIGSLIVAAAFIGNAVSALAGRERPPASDEDLAEVLATAARADDASAADHR